MKKVSKVQSIATSAIEALKLAYQENSDYHTSGMILAALAMVTQMREELSGMQNETVPCDPAEYCFPV
jgi:hypothetical protein